MGDFDEQDFYGDLPIENGETIGYCFYCKREIYETQAHVTYKEHEYHKECFIQSQLDTDGTIIHEE